MKDSTIIAGDDNVHPRRPMTAQPGPERSVAVGGDIRDSVLVLGDNNVLQVGARGRRDPPAAARHGHGADRRPRPHPRTPPPPPFPDRVDREQEIAAVRAASGHVNLHGGAGVGKTYACSRRCPTAPPTSTAPSWPVEDLLGSVCEELIESEPQVVLTPSRRRAELRDVDALVALDDVRVHVPGLPAAPDRGAALPVRADLASPHAPPGRADRGRRLGARGRASSSSPPTSAGRLRRTRRTRARAIAERLGGHPLMLRQAAGLGIPLEDLAGALAGDDPAGELSARLQAQLSDEDRELLATLAAAGGAPLGARRAAEATGRPDAPERLARMSSRGLLQSRSPRYTLAGALVEAPPEAGHRVETLATTLAGWAEH